mgnify:CR=1 FL=1
MTLWVRCVVAGCCPGGAVHRSLGVFCRWSRLRSLPAGGGGGAVLSCAGWRASPTAGLTGAARYLKCIGGQHRRGGRVGQCGSHPFDGGNQAAAAGYGASHIEAWRYDHQGVIPELQTISVIAETGNADTVTVVEHMVVAVGCVDDPGGFVADGYRAAGDAAGLCAGISGIVQPLKAPFSVGGERENIGGVERDSAG